MSAMMRREVLDDVGGFDPTFRDAEDRDLFVRLREHGVQIDVIPDMVLSQATAWREHDDEPARQPSVAPVVAAEARSRTRRAERNVTG